MCLTRQAIILGQILAKIEYPAFRLNKKILKFQLLKAHRAQLGQLSIKINLINGSILKLYYSKRRIDLLGTACKSGPLIGKIGNIFCFLAKTYNY